MSPVESLLLWYAANRRDLPWRRTRDPYRVWVSEVMLQQTRVETVLPRYARFLERFPDLAALAEAPLAEVLAEWAGLGYYRRARQLHAAARQVVAGGGALPESVAELRRLPGFGPYTAAAVASIALGQAVAVVDGNVERVLARRLGLREVRRGVGRRRLLAAAAASLDPERPGDSNQALMELGATVCLPRRPRCDACPWRSACRAAAQGEPERYPAPRPRRAAVVRRWVAALVEWQGRLLLVRRPPGSPFLAGTWELPWVEAAAGEQAVAGRFGETYGGSWRLGEPLFSLRHTITYRRLAVEVRRARLESDSGVREGVEAGFFRPQETAGLPRSSLLVKILRRAGVYSGGASS